MGRRMDFTNVNMFKRMEFIESREFSTVSGQGFTELFRYCEENQILAPFTYFLNDRRSFTLTVIPKEHIMVAVTNLDETEVPDLEGLILRIKTEYLTWIETEFMYGYLAGHRNIMTYLGVYDLASRLLAIQDSTLYDYCYKDNIHWLELNFPTVRFDRNFWEYAREESRKGLNQKGLI